MNLGTLEKTDDGYEATFERTLDHPPETVWKAITDPDEIETWFVRTELEPRKGGRYVEHHDHVGLSMEGEVTRFEPPHAFEHTWWAEPDQGITEASMLWELTPEGQGTRLVMHFRFQELENQIGSLAGWHVCLDVLEAVLDGEPPEDHAPPQGTFSGGEFTATEPGRGHWTRAEDLEGEYARHVDAMVPGGEDP